MQLSKALAFLAAGASTVAAQYSVEGTTTSTSTLYRTITITQCNPTMTDCPLHTPTTSSSIVIPTSSSIYTSSSVYSSSSSIVVSSSSSPAPIYSVANSTTAAGPTAYSNSTTWATTYSTPAPSVIQSSAGAPVPQPPTSASSAPTTIATGAANGLFVQTGFLLGVVGAGLTLLA